MIPACQETYNKLSSENEVISIEYKSDFDRPDFANLFQSNFEKDLSSQRTNFGIHRDDLVFHLDNYPIKKFGYWQLKKAFNRSYCLMTFLTS